MTYSILEKDVLLADFVDEGSNSSTDFGNHLLGVSNDLRSNLFSFFGEMFRGIGNELGKKAKEGHGVQWLIGAILNRSSEGLKTKKIFCSTNEIGGKKKNEIEKSVHLHRRRDLSSTTSP